MNVADRRDRRLLAGLAIALIVLLAGRATERPVRTLLDFTSEVERQYGLALVPALLILTVVFLVHLQGKRRDAKAEAAAAADSAGQALAFAAELERLVIFGQELGRALDADTTRAVVRQHLPTLAGTDDAWVMTRVDDRWQTVAPASAIDSEGQRIREHIAARILGDEGALAAGATNVDGHLCYPLAAPGFAVGVLAIPSSAGPFGEERKRILAMTAALLGISLRNAHVFGQVREISVRDGLTGCFNRTYALEAIGAELRRARRTRRPVSLAMIDIDHFKAINDRYGHLCGDAVLAAVGTCMRTSLRDSDMKCRYGGEEFLLLFPDTAMEGAGRAADHLRQELADMPIEWNHETLHITASFGIATAAPAEVDVQALVGRADQALYRAKRLGRNCVQFATEVATT